MNTIRLNAADRSKHLNACVATIGNFDGVHLGHQALIRELKALGEQFSLPTAVITFEPSPEAFFLKEKAPGRLMGFKEKFDVLSDLAVDVMCVLRFNREMADLSPQEFVEKILVENLGVKHIVVGEDFRFGRKREGDCALLQTLGKRLGFSVTTAPLVLKDGIKVSSTRIRAEMAAGNIHEVERLLDRKVIV